MQHAVKRELFVPGECGGRLESGPPDLGGLSGKAQGGKKKISLESDLKRENRLLREEVRKLRETLDRVGGLSALGTLAASVAHEIRNPLVSVRTFFRLAPQRWNDPEFAEGFRTLTEREVERISDLVTELLAMARPAAPDRESFPVRDLIDPVVLLLAPHARRRQVDLVSDVADDEGAVYGAPDQLKQVLLNLVLNAIEATSADGSVRMASEIVVDATGRFRRIEVRDTGEGISPEILEDIFTPFMTTKPDGTGLGLSIARRIVSEHGGTIDVESSPGGGTCFRIELPLNGESF